MQLNMYPALKVAFWCLLFLVGTAGTGQEASAQTTPPKPPKNDRKAALSARKNKVKEAKIKSETVFHFEVVKGQVAQTGVKQLEKTYDSEGNLLEETKFKRDGEIDQKVKNQYNAKGNVAKTEALKDTGLNNARPNKIDYAYDEEGNLIESTSLNPDGSVLVKTKNKYNDTGKMTEMLTENTSSDPRKKIFIKLNLSYNAEGEIAKAEALDGAGKILSVIEYKYDANGNLVEQVNQVQGKQLRLLHTYDANGKVLESTQLDEEGVVKSKTINKYDEKGNNIEMEIDHPAAEFKTKSENTFDAKGNITEQKTFNKRNEMISKLKYEYEYFE